MRASWLQKNAKVLAIFAFAGVAFVGNVLWAFLALIGGVLASAAVVFKFYGNERAMFGALRFVWQTISILCVPIAAAGVGEILSFAGQPDIGFRVREAGMYGWILVVAVWILYRMIEAGSDVRGRR